MEEQATFSFAYFALLVILALVGAGIIVGLKVLRGRQAARGEMDRQLETGAPAKPMSNERAQLMLRRYKLTAAAVIGALIVASLVAYGCRPG